MDSLIKLLAVGGIFAGVAAATKPSEKSFTKYFNSSLSNSLIEDNDLPSFVNKLIAKGVKASSKTYFKDYKVCRLAVVTLPGDDEEIYFLGAFGNWVEIPSLEIVDELGLKEE